MKATRRTIAASLLFLSLLVVNAQAQTIWQNVAPGDSNWQSAGNWSLGSVPTTSDAAQFDDTGLHSATPLSLGAASVGTLNFLNNTNNYTLGSGSDSLTFGGATALNQSGSGSNTIGAAIIANGLTANITAGTLTTTNSGNAITGASTFGVSGGATLNATGTSLGTAAVNLNNGTLVLAGASTTFSGLNSQYWPLSPGQGPANLGNGNQNNSWNTTNAGTVLATVNAFGPAVVQQTLPNNIAQITPPAANGYVAPNYGTPNNPFSGAAPATGYVGGIDFPNSNNNQNSFAAVGVNISGQGGANSGAPNYTATNGNIQYNSISAEWSGTVNIPAGGGALNFNVDSDDFSAVIVDGNIVLNRGNGGTGFSGNGSGGQGSGGSINLLAGAHSIEVVYDEGGGGWGIVGMYSFTPTGSPTAGPTTYIGNNDTTDGVTFTYTTFTNLTPSSNAINSTGNSTVTINSGAAETIGLVTLNAGTTLNINGAAPSATFSGLVLNGASTINNSMSVTAGPVTAGTGFTSLTAAGSGNLFLDNLTNSAFTPGTTINATGSGQVVGVNISGTNSLGQATLNVNGGNFSLGTNSDQAFANAITVNGSGGSITAQTLGAGATDGHTVTLSGGIALNSGTLSLNSNNGYAFTIATTPITGGGQLTANTNVNMNVANPSFSGTYNVNGGTTSENVTGGFGTAFVNINNGASLNMNTAGDTLGNGSSVNNGNLNLNAANININNTTVNGNGTLNIGASGGTGGVNLNNGSITQAQGGTQSFAGNLNLGSGTANIGNSGQNLNLTGSISGTGGLNQNGSGTTTLSGPLSYQGTTTVSTGTLALQSSMTGGGPVNVNPAGTLNVGTGGSVGASALTVSGGLATVTGNTNLGSGAANVNGGGTVQFNSANTSFTGSTMNFNNGTINAHSGVADLSGTNLVAVPFTNGILANTFQTHEYPNGSNTTNQDPNGGNNNVNTAIAANHYLAADLSSSISSPLLNAAHEGPSPGGINFPQDSDPKFQSFFATPSTADFGSTFYGVFTAPTAGSFHFGLNFNDDSASVVVQPLSSTSGGLFNTSGAGLQTASSGCCNNAAGFDTTATAGEQFLVAYTMRDTGGGSGLSGFITAPGGSAEIVDPGSAGQAGWWSTVNSISNGGATASIDAGATLKAGSFTGFTNVNLANGSNLSLSAHGSMVNSDTTNFSTTGTAALNLGANNTVHVQNFTVANGGQLNVSGGGALKVEGIGGAGTGTVAVTGGSSFGGPGSFAGTLSIGSGGTLAPGDAANTTVGGLNLADNSNMTYNLNIAGVEHLTYNPANGNDLTTVTGTNGLAISSSTYSAGSLGTTVNVIGGSNFGFGTYELLAYTGAFSGSLSSFGIGVAPSGFKYEFVNLANAGGGGGQIDLMVVPEPSTVVLMVLGLVGLAFASRRRWANRKT